jgi:hypothetical protein
VLMDANLYVELHSVLKSISTTAQYSLSFTFQPIAVGAAKKGQERGGNSLNIPHVNQSCNRPTLFKFPYLLTFVRKGIGIITQWTEDTHDDLARSQIRLLISSIESMARARGLLLDFQFMNDASYTQSPLQSYGSDSLALLKAASEKWDPDGVFQRLQNSGFLLSTAEMP